MNNFIFFGTDDFSIEVLKVLLENNFKPDYCITMPNRPKGRNLILTPPPIKIFCEKENIKVLQFEKLKADEIPEVDFYVVASYGKIIPREVIDKPKLGALNVHPSLLPKYRGASPIETAILNDDKKTGVTIMMMDEQMDHGPLISQKEIIFEEWKNKSEIRDQLAKIGGEMLVEIIPHIKNIQPVEQDHEKATFTKMIQKSDGLLTGTESGEWRVGRQEYLKYLAYTPWPGVYFFVEKNGKQIRVKITEAEFKDEEFKIKKVIPEGKSEMTFESFENGYLKI